MPTTNVNWPIELEEKAGEMERNAEGLLKAAQKLRDAADVLRDAAVTNGATKRSPGRPKKTGMTRVQELKQFVQSQGTVSRQEAMQQAGMPRGTVGALLTRKHGFEQGEDGRWFVPEDAQENEE